MGLIKDANMDEKLKKIKHDLRMDLMLNRNTRYQVLKEYGFKGSKKQVYQQLCEYLKTL